MLPLLLACHLERDAKDSESVMDSGGDSPTDTALEDSAPPDTGDSSDTADTSSPCTDTAAWYADVDGDGFGGEPSCSDQAGATLVSGDCDDARASVYPGAVERATSGRDDDCDGRGSTTDLTLLRGLQLAELRSDETQLTGPSAGLSLTHDANADGSKDLVIGAVWTEADGVGHAGTVVFYSPLTQDGGATEFDEGDARIFLPRGTEPERASMVGDTNGDGWSELLLTATINTYDAQVYILAGPIPEGANQLDTTHIFAEREDSELYFAPVAPGDLDGDGLDDLVLSDMYGADKGGEVFFFHGPLAGRGLADADTLLHGTAGATSGAPYDEVGRSTTNLGDLDGDGLPEIGDIGGDGGNIFYDPPPGVHHFEDVATLIDTRYGGYRASGVHISGLGDVNGDGHRDIAMPTPANPYLMVLLGPFPETETRYLWDDWDVAFYGDNWGLGETDIDTIVSLGDWDDDGHEDFAINNTLAVPAERKDDCVPPWDGCQDGAVFLIAGPVPPGVYDFERAADRLNPPVHTNGFAEAIAGGGDLDQDGYPDLAIASLDLNSVFVVFGGGIE